MASLVVGTAGHVDHGKSTLVRALTGLDPDRPGVDRVAVDRAGLDRPHVDRPDVDRLNVDRLKDEQRRGITIDLGFAHTRIGDADVAFVDVPGHERFVRNMLAGAGGIDAVLLVVAADESVMPQTREHLAICRMLGLTRGVIALTKADRVDEDTVAIVALEIGELVAGTFLEGAPVIPVSARTGSGIDALRGALAQLAGGDAAAAEPFAARLSVDRAFSVKGFGTVVTGTLVSGAIGEGDEVELLPERRRARVRGVHVHNRPVPRAAAPRRVALNLGHVAVDDVGRGVTIASPETIAVTRRIDVAIELLPAAVPLRHGGRVRVHLGTADVGARVAVSATRAAADAAWRSAAVGEAAVVVPPGGYAFARLRLDDPVAATRGDRLVLRSSSPPTTVGGGVVLDPEPPARGLRRGPALARFVALGSPAAFVPTSRQRPAGDHTLDDPAAATFLGEAGARGLCADDLVRRCGRHRAEADAWIAVSVAAGRAVAGVTDNRRVFDAPAVAAAEATAAVKIASMSAAAERAGGEDGVAREALREHFARHADTGWFDLIISRLAAAGVVVGTDRITLAGQGRGPDVALTQAVQAIEEEIRRAGLTPPDIPRLGAANASDPTLVERAVRGLLRDRRIVRLGELVFHADTLARLRADLQARATAERAAGRPGHLDVAAFKAEHGLSRKYAIPLLEWLDRERVTRRVGETRILL